MITQGVRVIPDLLHKHALFCIVYRYYHGSLEVSNLDKFLL